MIDESVIEKIRDDMCADQFEIGAMTFKVNKLSALDGHDVFEKIRYEFSQSLGGMPADKSGDTEGFVLAFLALRPEFVRSIREKIFHNIQFKGNGAHDWVRLSGSENMAFAQLEPIHIYEVLARGLAVNFTGSLLAITSKLPGMISATSR